MIRSCYNSRTTNGVDLKLSGLINIDKTNWLRSKNKKMTSWGQNMTSCRIFGFSFILSMIWETMTSSVFNFNQNLLCGSSGTNSFQMVKTEWKMLHYTGIELSNSGSWSTNCFLYFPNHKQHIFDFSQILNKQIFQIQNYKFLKLYNFIQNNSHAKRTATALVMILPSLLVTLAFFAILYKS